MKNLSAHQFEVQRMVLDAKYAGGDGKLYSEDLAWSKVEKHKRTCPLCAQIQALVEES